MPTNMLPLPSFDRLNDLLQYNPDTGELRWKVNRGSNRAGNIAGYIKTRKGGQQEWAVRINGKRYFSARIIWMLYRRQDPGTLTIDHLNRDPLDNRITNLRLADMHQQNMNTQCTSPSTAVRYRGLVVHSNKNNSRRPRWYGKIKISGHYYHFGSVAVDSINDNPPQWLIDRAARLYTMRDDPAISDEDLIREITG